MTTQQQSYHKEKKIFNMYDPYGNLVRVSDGAGNPVDIANDPDFSSPMVLSS